MNTIDLATEAEPQGLLRSSAGEAYLRQTLQKPDLETTTRELRELCKGSTITVDSFLEERHAEAVREEADCYRLMHYEDKECVMCLMPAL